MNYTDPQVGLQNRGRGAREALTTYVSGGAVVGNRHAPEGQVMIDARKLAAGIYVDKVRHLWIVRDPKGNFWTLPPGDDPWERREPFEATAESDLERVPGHYKIMLGLPF